MLKQEPPLLLCRNSDPFIPLFLCANQLAEIIFMSRYFSLINFACIETASESINTLAIAIKFNFL